MAGYWPWWAGAAALAAITVGCCIVARRPLGVSGILSRFVNLREELTQERQARAMASRDDAVEAAMLAATLEAFGPLPEGHEPAAPAAAGPPLPVASTRCSTGCLVAASRPTLGAHATFLAAIALGGLAARLLGDSFHLSLDMGDTFALLVGSGWKGALGLVGGGLLAGFGTTLAGGCSTGHGLSGCSRLQVGSVAATGAFVGAAVAVSFLLEHLAT
jgi:hypothetical protein